VPPRPLSAPQTVRPHPAASAWGSDPSLFALARQRALLETGPDRHLNRGLRQDGAP